MVYNVINLQNLEFVQYINNWDFGVSQIDLENGLVGDFGFEGLVFILVGSSFNSKLMLVVGNEVSGIMILYGIDVIEFVVE